MLEALLLLLIFSALPALAKLLRTLISLISYVVAGSVLLTLGVAVLLAAVSGGHLA